MEIINFALESTPTLRQLSLSAAVRQLHLRLRRRRQHLRRRRQLRPQHLQRLTPVQITLIARGYKVQGQQRVDLSWNGASSNNIDVYRNGVLIATVPNIPGFLHRSHRRAWQGHATPIGSA